MGTIFSNGAFGNRPTAAVELGFNGDGDYYYSDYFVQNASFLRCDNISLGYSFDHLFRTQAYKGINGRIYATVQNPFVLQNMMDLIRRLVLTVIRTSGLIIISTHVLLLS